ncbi:MAG TPA: hypothetical protein VGQ09_06015 [Chitinophagaceae bacterium]|nr:hypothetical protein [Chitinophagaceae bacterium]
MKLILVILLSSLLVQPFRWQHNYSATQAHAVANQLPLKNVDGDSSQSIRIINASSLVRLPGVVKDLSAVLHQSLFPQKSLMDKNGFAIYLYDVNCNSFENSAAIRYQISDTIYHLKLNRFNRKATDKALAATLIHEMMHCLLLDLYKRAQKGDEKAIASIASFGLNKNDTSSFFNNDFFVLVNRGEEGQHELIYQLFYPSMVSLLKHFASVHKETFSDQRDAEFLMWSGLQKTTAYQKLDDEEKREIESTILKAKGANIRLD